MKKKKRKRKRGKKISLPNNVAPIIVVPHENDTLDDDLVMPIACCDDYDWEDNDTSYDLENLFGTCLEQYDNCYTIGAIHTINDESDYAYDMKRPKLGDAMFDENDMFENIFAAINVCPKLGDAMFNEDDIFSLPSFDMQIYYDDSMPPIYDDYIDESGFGRVSTLGSSDPTILEDVESYNIYESGFGEVMTLFSDESTISEEVPIDYENKVAIYDDYCDDMYAIKNNDNHETCHHDFNFQLDYASHDSYFVEFAPTTIHENKFAYVESSKISMQVDHEKNALGAGYIVEFIHDATENYYEGGTYACRNCNNIKFPLYVLKILKLCLFCLPMLVDYCSHKLFAHKIPMHRKWVRLKCASHILHDALFMFQFLSFM